MFDWSGENADRSGKSQGILISCVSGNPVIETASYRGKIRNREKLFMSCEMLYRKGHDYSQIKRSCAITRPSGDYAFFHIVTNLMHRTKNTFKMYLCRPQLMSLWWRNSCIVICIKI